MQKNVLLLIVGLWFLRDDDVWKSISEYISYNFYLQGPEAALKNNTIGRHMAGGRSEQDAHRFYDFSDSLNAREIASHSIAPDETISYFGEIV
ncbi:MAG: hypothetical protein ACREGH_03375 [Minisyncoccia bacterium]